ncbi:MAG: LD-carboxypeptidase, partial [Acidobacteriaceae bacterium]
MPEVPPPITPRPKLQQGSRIAIVSPASAAKPELVAQGRAALEAAGYQTILMSHALDRGPLYYAGTAQDRAADLHAAFADPTIDAIH